MMTSHSSSFISCARLAGLLLMLLLFLELLDFGKFFIMSMFSMKASHMTRVCGMANW